MPPAVNTAANNTFLLEEVLFDDSDLRRDDGHDARRARRSSSRSLDVFDEVIDEEEEHRVDVSA